MDAPISNSFCALLNPANNIPDWEFGNQIKKASLNPSAFQLTLLPQAKGHLFVFFNCSFNMSI